MELKDVIKSPFSNYDLVVYFGCGLFVVPFVNRYVVEPLNLTWPTFKILGAVPFTAEVISALSLLMFVYIIGHILAYVSSQLIEKTIDRFLGKVSTAIIFLTIGRAGLRNGRVRKHIYHQFLKIREDRAIIASLFRGIFHAPALISYSVIGFLGIFGYYNSRLSIHTVAALARGISKLGIPRLRLSPNMPWFKPVEYYVINRVPEAVPRMYNYLVIGGLFRSLSAIFLFSMWLVLAHLACWWFTGVWRLEPLGGMTPGVAAIWEFVSLQLLFIFSLFSYIKFQRRYAEEAIFAFIFEPGSELTHKPRQPRVASV
ncbi:MAG: hypothetical protein H0W71_09995 [Sphingomonas sp.]|nr:hypothetical protein [Sphingomonas sp.]